MQILDRRQQREREATEERSVWSLLAVWCREMHEFSVIFHRMNSYWRRVAASTLAHPSATFSLTKLMVSFGAGGGWYSTRRRHC